MVKATEKYDAEIKTLLATEGYNVEVKAYEFKGNEWYFNLILNYGHILVTWMAMTKYKS